MTTTEAKPQTLGEALLAFQKDIPTLDLTKDATGQVGGRKYKYLSLKKLTKSTQPALIRHGLLWITRPSHEEEGRPVLLYELRLARYMVDGKPLTLDDRIAGTMPLLLGATPNSQALGSAITYAKRYATEAVLGIVGDEGTDDDGAAASKTEVRARRPPAPKDQQPTMEIDRLMTDEELGILMQAMKGQNHDLLLASEDVDDLAELTVSKGRNIMRKIKV